MVPDWASFRYNRRTSFHAYTAAIIPEWKAGKTSVGWKYELADQANQPTCLIPYLNELQPPLHDHFWNEYSDPV